MNKELTVVEAYEAIQSNQSLQLIDVRSAVEFEKDALQGFTNIPLSEISQAMPKLDGKKKTILICSDGTQSHQAQTLLEACGYEPLTVRGGIRDWKLVIEA
ncbi:MAG: rhodanese-like domain-containing protein [SAR324 cluster bacterium]|nr:rhodanese-like domain-containing protein [SAR324 cluster bacterium]